MLLKLTPAYDANSSYALSKKIKEDYIETNKVILYFYKVANMIICVDRINHSTSYTLSVICMHDKPRKEDIYNTMKWLKENLDKEIDGPLPRGIYNFCNTWLERYNADTFTINSY